VTFFHLLIDNVNVGHSGDNLVFNNRLDLERGMKYYSNLLYEFYKTPFCRTRFLEHEERSDECYKQTSATKWLIKRV
jgi:hypothetical protein